MRGLGWLRRMPDAAIALGSNLGERARNLQTAIRLIESLGKVGAVSAFYDTAPVGFVEQPRFLNAALVLDTELEPLELLHALLEVERTMGRTRTGVPPKGPRAIDLDLILYGDVVLKTAELTLPHPEFVDREFVLGPLAEIAGEMRHPVLGVTVAELLRRVRLADQAPLVALLP